MEPAHRPLVVVGAGPQALALLVALVDADPAWRDRTTVIDPAGRWLRTWDEQLARARIDALRSPGVHHPGIEPEALRVWSRERNLERPSRYGQPATEAFATYCTHLIDHYGLESLVHTGRARLLADDGSGVHLLLDDRTVLTCDRAVLATNPGRRRIPAWVEDLLPVSVGRLQHAADVDLRTADVTGEAIVVVGGGLTAAQLALGALEQGAASVHLLIRRHLRASTFDTDPGWLGPKELRGFERLAPADRAEAVQRARDGGSVPMGEANRLRREAAEGNLALREGTRVVAGRRHGDRLTLVLGDEEHVHADRIWLATGTEACVEATPLLDDLRRSHPTEIHAGLPWLDADLAWPGSHVHLMGRLTSLNLGPAAGNLWGARRAADRIAPTLAALALDGGVPATR